METNRALARKNPPPAVWRWAVLVAISVAMFGNYLSPLFPVMAAGRLIFGLGAESMIVAVTVAIGQWFVGRQLGLAFGVNLSIARAGSYSADLSTTWFKGLYEAGWQAPLLFAAAMSAVASSGASSITPMLWLFMVLSLFGLVFAYALRLREVGPHGHRLEEMSAGTR